MNLKPRRLLVPVFALLVFFAVATVASAHPLGNFTINHYARIEPAAKDLRVRYVLDYAEIPAFQEKQVMDADSDGTITDAERATYLATHLPLLLQNVKLTVNGQPVDLQVEAGSPKIDFLPGQGGLEIMHLSAWLHAPYTLTNGGDSLSFEDDNYTERLGWREIVAVAAAGTALKNSSVSEHDVSNELSAYPSDMLTNPLNERVATMTVVPGAGASVTTNSAAPVTDPTGALGVFDRTKDDFAKLITSQDALSPSVLFFALLLSIGLGALHAFTPGHGKAVVGAYLVGSRGTWQHAVFLGLIVTITHTAGVYALGGVTLFLSAYIFPDQLLPWLGFISGMLVAMIGIRLLVERWRAARSKTTSYDKAMRSANATRMYTGSNFGPQLVTAGAEAGSGGQDTTMNAAAVAAPMHTYANGQAHSHVFATPEEEDAHAREHLAEIQAMEKPTWKNLLSLGISGGLLPCPSALVVMLSAIALGRVLYGFYLIIGFSIGLAGVLVLTGLALLYAGKFAGKYLAGERVGPVMRFLPIVGALFVAILGIGIAFDAVFATGLVR